nr:YjbH domain-containing protein [Phaeobacter inhibens]
MLPDGQFATTYSWFGGQARYNLTFQATPWLSASRYNSTNGRHSTYLHRRPDGSQRALSPGGDPGSAGFCRHRDLCRGIYRRHQEF